MRSPRPAWVLLGLTAAATLAADQLSKSWAVSALADRDIDIVWTLRFALSINTGAAFSIGRGRPELFAVLGVILVVALLVGARHLTGTAAAVATGLIVGGAAGNLVDRFLRDFDGGVVDFIDLQWWPVFNLADAAIVCGAVLLVISTGRDREPDPADRVEATS